MDPNSPASEFPEEGPWTLPIEGFAVTHITFGGLIDIVAYGEGAGRSESGAIRPAPSTQIRFESKFELVEPGSKTLRLDPSGQEREDLMPIFALRHDRIASATATEDAQLEIRFTSGRRIAAEPDPNYENWAISGPGFELISMPGGGVALFRPPEG